MHVKSLKPSDDLISWKWLLDKRDVTIVGAPEQGTDLPIRQVARRLMSLAEKNSRAFQRLNTKRAERLANIEGLKSEIKALETELDGLAKAIDIARLEAEERAMNPQAVVEPEPAPEPAPEPQSAPEPAMGSDEPLVINGNTYTATDLNAQGAQSAMDAAIARNGGDLFAAARDLYQNSDIMTTNHSGRQRRWAERTQGEERHLLWSAAQSRSLGPGGQPVFARDPT